MGYLVRGQSKSGFNDQQEDDDKKDDNRDTEYNDMYNNYDDDIDIIQLDHMQKQREVVYTYVLSTLNHEENQLGEELFLQDIFVNSSKYFQENHEVLTENLMNAYTRLDRIAKFIPSLIPSLTILNINHN